VSAQRVLAYSAFGASAAAVVAGTITFALCRGPRSEERMYEKQAGRSALLGSLKISGDPTHNDLVASTIAYNPRDRHLGCERAVLFLAARSSTSSTHRRASPASRTTSRSPGLLGSPDSGGSYAFLTHAAREARTARLLAHEPGPQSNDRAPWSMSR